MSKKLLFTVNSNYTVYFYDDGTYIDEEMMELGNEPSRWSMDKDGRLMYIYGRDYIEGVRRYDYWPTTDTCYKQIMQQFDWLDIEQVLEDIYESNDPANTNNNSN